MCQRLPTESTPNKGTCNDRPSVFFYPQLLPRRSIQLSTKPIFCLDNQKRYNGQTQGTNRVEADCPGSPASPRKEQSSAGQAASRI